MSSASGAGGDAGASASATTTTGSGGGDPFNGYSRADGGKSDALDRSADAVVAPDGSIYVSWVDGAEDVLVARSIDGGKSFGPAVKVDDAAVVPLVTMARHPRLATDGARVALALNDKGGTVYLYLADADTLAFGQPIVIGKDVNTSFRDFPKPVFLPDGSVGVAYHGYPQSGARLFFAREGSGYASEVASGGAPGVPCECCPLELAFGAGDDLMLAFRNNDKNLREMWVASAPAGSSFSSWVAGSKTEGLVPECPMQGPRLVHTEASDVMVWSSRGTDKGAVLVAFGNGEGGWSGGAPIAGFIGDEPTIALGASGKLYVAAVTGNKKSSLVTSEDGGKSWSAPEPLAAPDGSLSTPQAHSQGGIAVLAGVSSAGSVWLLRTE